MTRWLFAVGLALWGLACRALPPSPAGTAPLVAETVDGHQLTVLPILIPGSCRKPEYPQELRQARVAGRVHLEFIIDSSGTVEPRSARAIGGDTRFAESALAAIYSCHFAPGSLDGHPARARVKAPINYDM